MNFQLNVSRKNIITRIFTVIAFSSLISISASAQSKMGTGLVGPAKLQPDDKNAIVSFSPVYNNGKTFLRWLVQNDEKDGIFIVERSADGNEYQALGFKDRVGTPLCVNLFYSFTDNEPVIGQSYYRVMTVGTDQTYSYSDVIRVRTDLPASNSPANSVMSTGK